MNKLIGIIFLALVIWGCSSPKEDKVRLNVLKSVYDDKWGTCNRAVYAQEKTTVENGSKDAYKLVWNESTYYRDSTLKYLESGNVTMAKTLIAKGLTAKQLNAEHLIRQMNQLDSAYAVQKDSTSLMYAEISVVTGLAQILRDNSARLSSGF